MFKLVVIFVHAIMFLLVTIIGLGGKYNPAPPEPGVTYGIWFTIFVFFNILILVSAFIQLRIKKVSVLVITVLGLFVFFILTLQYIYPMFMDLF